MFTVFCGRKCDLIELEITPQLLFRPSGCPFDRQPDSIHAECGGPVWEHVAGRPCGTEIATLHKQTLEPKTSVAPLKL